MIPLQDELSKFINNIYILTMNLLLLKYSLITNTKVTYKVIKQN